MSQVGLGKVEADRDANLVVNAIQNQNNLARLHN